MKKIIAIVAVIAAITACFCIGANAIDKGETLKAGTKITFKEPDEIVWGMSNINMLMPISSGNKDYYGVKIAYTAKTLGYSNTSTFTNTDNYILNNEIQDVVLKTFTVKKDTTINNEGFATFLTNNATIEEPSPIKDVVSNTKTTFSTTLYAGSLLISWLVANQIALVGLYMYILITLLLIGKRNIKGA